MDSLCAAEVRDAGLVIAFARRIESRMTELGAAEAGLHDKADFLVPRLSQETVKKLHFIGAVRNRAAHEDCRFTPEEIRDYTEACNEVLQELASLGATEVAEVSMPELTEPDSDPSPRHENRTADPSPRSSSHEEPHWKFWDLCAVIPEAHIVYLCMVLLRNCADVLDDLFALIFGIFSLYFIAAGILSRQPAGIWFGAAVLVLVYLFACFRAQSSNICEKLPKIWKYLPILNGVVFLLRTAESFRYLETAFALLGLAATLFGTILFWDDWRLGTGLYLAGYASDIILWFIRRNRRD